MHPFLNRKPLERFHHKHKHNIIMFMDFTPDMVSLRFLFAFPTFAIRAEYHVGGVSTVILPVNFDLATLEQSSFLHYIS